MEKRGYKQLITEIVLRHIESLGNSDRERAKEAGIAHTAIGKMRKGTGMTLTTLEKIVNKFPELKPHILNVFNDYVSVNTEKKLTGEGANGNKEDSDKEELIESQMVYIENLQKEIRNLRKRIKGEKESGDIASIADY